MQGGERVRGHRQGVEGAMEIGLGLKGHFHLGLCTQRGGGGYNECGFGNTPG